MRDRSERISRLKNDRKSREAYVGAKLGILVPSQIRALRLKSNTPKQQALAKLTGIHQPRLSMLETAGAANVTLETLAEIAAIHKVGVIVKFVPYSEMLEWENNYSQDNFSVTPLDRDMAFLEPGKSISFSSARSKSLGGKVIQPNRDSFIDVKIEVPDKASIVPVGIRRFEMGIN
jgi:transcriptional regulator with XRE-family HTH domain